MRSRFLLGIFAPLALLLACEKQSDTIPVTGITLEPASVDLVDGESITITATIFPSDATNKLVKWSSSNPSIQVSDGKISTSFKPDTPTTFINGKPALGNGTITATTEDGNKKAKCQVTVYAKTIAVTGIRLAESSLQLNKGESRSLIATVQPDNATDKTVQWTSSDSSVASVDQDGTITAVGGGKATIIASAGVFSASCSVNVVIPVSSVSLDMSILSLEIGTFALLTATVLPEDAIDKNVQWSSDNPSIAEVDQNGKVTAISVGKATVSATAGGISASCSVICTGVPVTSIVIDKARLSLAKGESVLLTSIVKPDNATDKVVRWDSDNPSVATVDQNGLVNAINCGNAVITASNGEISATCEVSVFIPVTSIMLNSTDLKLLVGDIALLEAIVLPEDATYNKVSWFSSNLEVATVDEGGKVTALNFGHTDITAQVGDQIATCTVIVLTDSPVGVTADYYGGEISVLDDLIQYGSCLDFGITNMTSERITVKTAQLFDGESGDGADVISIDCALEPGSSLRWRTDVPARGIYSPRAVFTYSFRDEEYTCTAKYSIPVLEFKPIP